MFLFTLIWSFKDLSDGIESQAKSLIQAKEVAQKHWIVFAKESSSKMSLFLLRNRTWWLGGSVKPYNRYNTYNKKVYLSGTTTFLITAEVKY